MILQNYVCELPEFFTSKEVQDFHTYANTLPVDSGRVGDSQQDNDADDSNFNINDSIRRSTVKWFKDDSNLEFDMMGKIHEGLRQAKEVSGWEHQYDYIENLQYTIYRESTETKGDFYTWHTDAGDTLYDNGIITSPSCTRIMSDPDDYEGGNLQLLDESGTSYIAPRQRGTMILFDSRTQHRVLKVTKGCRKSLVGWTIGPRWK